VDTSQLGKAMAFTQASGLIAIVVGQAAAGLLLSRFEAHTLFGVDGTSYFISAACLLFIRLVVVKKKKAEANVFRTVGSDIREGLVYIWHNRGLRNLLLASLPIQLFTSPVLVFLPFYTTNALHEPLSRYGYLLSMISVGILVGLVAGGKVNSQGPHVHALLFGCVALNAVLIFVLSTLHWFWAAMADLFVSGILAGLTMLLALNTVVLKTDPEKRGRTTSIMMLVGQGVTPLAMSVVGYFGDRLGGRVQLLYTGFSILLFVTAICLYFNRDLRRLFAAGQHASG
jgi:Na+/melibiose symporter-like transporter